MRSGEININKGLVMDYQLQDFFNLAIKDSRFILNCIGNDDDSFGDSERVFSHLEKTAEMILKQCEYYDVLGKASIVIANESNLSIRDVKKIHELASDALYSCSAEYAVTKEFHTIKTNKDSLVFQILKIEKVENEECDAEDWDEGDIEAYIYTVHINVLYSFVCVDDEGINNAVVETAGSSQKLERHVY